MRQASPHRQLNVEETRIYAAGMAAARRGEKAPATRLPPEIYKIWHMGWNRVGRVLHGRGPITRSTNHHTQANGVHMVRTEVETLEQALDVIAIAQRRQKAAATMVATHAKRDTWHTELHMHGMRQKSSRSSPKARELQLLRSEQISDLEQTLVERLERVIGILHHSVEEMSLTPMQPRHHKLSQINLIDVIGKMCFILDRPMPEFGVGRKPQQTGRPRCIECGTELVTAATIRDGRCVHCAAPDPLLLAASATRREHARVAQEVTRLERKIRKTEKVIDGDYEGYGGYSGEDFTDLEARGREEDVGERGQDADRAGAGGAGDAQGGDRGRAPDPDPAGPGVADGSG